MEIKKVLSFIGGFENSTEFKLDLSKVSDISEYTEEEVTEELNKLQEKGDIIMDGNNITLINIKPKKNKNFNDLYAPIETMIWGKGMKLKLDK